MYILNFSHPFTDEQRAQIEELTGSTISAIHAIEVQIRELEPLEAQIRTLIDALPLSPDEWQTLPLLVNPPGYAPAAFVLLAELHGRIGHFPSLIRLRPRAGAITRYEVAELMNLQGIRERARMRRWGAG